MTTIVRWLLPIVGGIVGRWLAGKFSGSCPLDASSFVCLHWEAIASAAGVILGALGYKVTRPKLATSKAPQQAMTTTITAVPEAPEVSTTAPLGVEVHIETQDPSEIDWDKRDG